MPVRPILLALVTITQQRQPHVLADMFDYCIHKPVDRNQMEVFPTAISNNFPEGDGIVRNDSTEKPKPDTKTAEAAAPSAATPKKAEEEKPPAPTVASVTPALKAVKLEESAKAPAPAKTPAPDKAPASQKETSLPSVHTGKPAPAKVRSF